MLLEKLQSYLDYILKQPTVFIASRYGQNKDLSKSITSEIQVKLETYIQGKSQVLFILFYFISFEKLVSANPPKTQ